MLRLRKLYGFGLRDSIQRNYTCNATLVNGDLTHNEHYWTVEYSWPVNYSLLTE
jgi:hypothetical protein